MTTDMQLATTDDEIDAYGPPDPYKIGFEAYVIWFLRATAAAVTFRDYDHPEPILGCVTNIAEVFKRPKEDEDALLAAVGRQTTREVGYERTPVRPAIIGKKVYPAEYRVKVWSTAAA